MGLVGEDHFFGAAECRKLSELTGGTAHTIAVTEVSVDQSVHWMEPTDIGVEFLNTIQQEHELAHTGGVQVLFADGSARFISENTAPETIHSLMSVSESVVGEF